jgi:hypothetical protein
MSREIKTDFTKLLEFVENYNLTSQCSNEDFKNILSQIHKKYYAILAFIMELILMENPQNKKVLNAKENNYILESLSDIGNSIFLLINGAYKPSKLMLRSSIETFLKGISLFRLNNIDEEKRIYQMFDRINEIDFFKTDIINKRLFDDLNNMYAELSKDIHTADENHMQHTSSLNYFPTISMPNLKDTNKYILKVIQTEMTILAIRFNSEYHRMHHTNKTIIIENINKKYRQKIHNIE